MNARDSYNYLIRSIEEQAEKKYENADKIVLSMQKKMCCDARDLNALFRFMTGETILEYVKKRKLMASYEVLIRQQTFKVEDAIDVSGYDNQSSFTKKFSSEFGMSPKEAHKKKDRSLYTPAKTWEEISCDSNQNDGTGEKLPMKQETKFGILQSSYQQALKIIELESIYGFGKMYTKLANMLFEELESPIEDVFGFVESIRTFCGYNIDDAKRTYKFNKTLKNESIWFENRVKEIANSPYIRYAYFKCGFSVGLAMELDYCIPMTQSEIMEIDVNLLKAYVRYTDVNFNHFKKAYNYFMLNCDGVYDDEKLNEFLDRVACDEPIETAFDDIDLFFGEIDDDQFEPIMSKQEEEKLLFADFDFIERMAKEEERWHGINISDRYDEENEAYYE